jgi:GT2 family glycosyltransferase/glycosyltransferase involved in cell wall biosynthesis
MSEESTLFLPLPLSGSPAGLFRRRRICIASFDFSGPVRNGGVGTAFTSLGEALAAAGHEVTFLYLSGDYCETPRTLTEWIADYERKGIRFVPLPEKLEPKLHSHATPPMAKSYRAYQWLREQKFDVIHFSEWRGPGYYSLVAKHQGLGFSDTLLCVHTHGPTLWSLLSNGEYITNVMELELDFMERESVRLADVVASPSQYLLRWMAEQDWQLPATTYVQQYVRPATAHPLSGAAGGEAARIGEFVFFGRLEVRKGLVLFCDALDRLKDDPALRHLSVTFLGKLTKIDRRNADEYLAARSKAWSWKCQVISDRDQAGALDHLRGAGRLAVIPSMVDNLPNTVLECLGAQVPFLASTTGGIPEMIAAGGREAILFPLRVGPLAEKLRRAVIDGVRPSHFAVEPEANRRAWLDWHVDAAGTPAVSSAQTVAEPGRPEPLVSICLSHFNRPKYLRQALASIEAQDYRRFEVVLVDDASTQPEAIAYLESLVPKFAERGWQLIRNPQELFVGAARNVAARHARGEYLKFMDDDNVAKPHEVSTLLQVARRTKADLVSCALDFFWGDAAPQAGQAPSSRCLFLGPAVSASVLRNCLGDTNFLVRREVFFQLGGFHEEWRTGNEDWKFLGSAVLKGFRLETVPEALVWYRRADSGENATAKNSLHAGHMQNIGPYLDAVPRELRNVILYAQGVSLRGDQPDQAVEILPYVQHTVSWKSKLEAGRTLAALGQRQAAVRTMLDGVKAVQACGVPRIVLEALLGIAEPLGPLEPNRARFLLDCAVKLAQSHRRTKEIAQAQRLIAELDEIVRTNSPPPAGAPVPPSPVLCA